MAIEMLNFLTTLSVFEVRKVRCEKMGCVSSVEVAKGQRRIRPKPDAGRAIRSMGSMAGTSTGSSPGDMFLAITSGVKTIAAPANMMPIVCLVQHAFPIVTSMLHLEDSTPTEIHLPIIAASCFGSGRVIAFAQMQFLSQKAIHTADTSKLLVNALNWISGGSSSMINVCVLGFNKQNLPSIQKPLQELGFFAEPAGSRTQFGNYRSVVIPSDLNLEGNDLIDRLAEYVNNGGGLAVFYRHSDAPQVTMPINKLLLKFGISFTYCLLNEELDSAENIVIPTTFNQIQNSNFVPLTGEFRAMVNQDDVNTSDLDDLVTTLRYYVMVCDESYTTTLKDIADASWSFLKKNHYSTPDGICPEICHGIVVVLLQDLYAKLPISEVDPIPERDDFPGKTGEVEMGDHSMTLEIGDESWTSTGLWLPPGIEATVHCSEDVKALCIRIGSHHRSLLTRTGPWHRWPSVVSLYQVEKEETEVGSAFGGIVYAAASSFEPIDPFTVTLTFKNFCKYPRYVQDSPEIWAETKDIDVPWGEIETEGVIFTLPSERMRQIEDFDRVVHVYGTVTKFVSDYLSYKVAKPHRIVFDVDLDGEEIEEDYPLVLRIEEIDDVLVNINDLNAKFIQVITLITLMSFRENCFDVATEKALASVVVALILQELFPGFDPLTSSQWNPPLLFKEFWEIHSQVDPELIPKTLATFQDPNYPIVEQFPEDLWIAFVRQMCRVGKCNFTELLEKSRPIPLNISLSLQGLPPYKPPPPT